MDLGIGRKNIDLAFATVPDVNGQGLNLVRGIVVNEGLRTGGQADAITSAIADDKKHGHFA